MWNSVIGSVTNCIIETSDNRVRVKGRLDHASGGLIHVQNLISTFGGVLSIMSWESSVDNKPMAFMQYTIDNYLIGFSFALTIDITPEMAANQITAFRGNDLIKFKKCALTLVDNSYFVPPFQSEYEASKKAIVN